MKSWIMLLFLGLSAAAPAAAEPSALPAATIRLTEVDSSGRAIESETKYELTVHRDRLGNVASFDFSETSPTECHPTGCISAYRTTLYQITASRADSCGDYRYFAPEPAGNGHGHLEVLDYSQRTCPWNRAYRIEAYLTGSDDSVRRFIANPG